MVYVAPIQWKPLKAVSKKKICVNCSVLAKKPLSVSSNNIGSVVALKHQMDVKHNVEDKRN